MGVLDTINAVCQLDKHTETKLRSFLRTKVVSKGTLLLHPGDTCKHIYFLEAGFAHQFQYKNGNKVSNYFWMQNDFVTHMASFLSQTSSEEGIEVLQDSTLSCFSYEHLQYMYGNHMEFNVLGRLILEKYFIELAGLGSLSKIKPARKRYEKLLKDKPELMEYASLGQIASYLNISIETLSRIRH